ncbi:hypothetical protein I551_4453 [Mycobacterium ulcerans str. Harvey]|uniref:Uncharacterized protein n=1 Tax=Mycobacterium ulcerans str. Harvey TaxID=1299332 RepID=A0ABN0QWL4_MYCUL|nr:hypothetical protein I551_4453 [Mycobacterium ulcerans str. Harvey]
MTGSRVRRRELCDLPLGDGEFWTITEGPVAARTTCGW